MQKYVEKSAKTQEEAISAALAELNASISDVTIEVVQEGSKGLFGLFGSRPAVVRVTMKEEEQEDDLVASLLETKKPARKPAPAPKAEPKPEKKAEPKPEKKAEKPAETKTEAKAEPKAEKMPEPVRRTAPKAEGENAEAKPARQRKPRAPKAEGEENAKPQQPRKKAPKQEKAAEPAEKKPLPPKAPAKPIEKPVVTMIPNEEIVADSPAGKAQAFLKELTGLMGVEVDIAMGTDAEGNVFAQMTGDTLGILIGRRGETLDAVQYLTSLKVNRGQEGYTRVTIDTENYRAKREDTLIRLANRMANRAVKTGRKVALEPMNPYERRIIHSALQANEAVDTHSEGEEPNRHVVITLRKA